MGTAADDPQDEGMDVTPGTPPFSEGAPAPGGQEPESSRPPLERSASHRVVTGVCGGLGRRLDIDPLVFRVVIAVLCLWGGIGLFIYGVAWLMIPMEGTGKNELQRLMSGRVDGQSLGAVLVTVLGTGIFFSYMGAKGHIFPLLLIAALAFAALRYDPKRHQLPPREPEPAVAQEPPPAAPNWWQRPDPLLKTSAPPAPSDAIPGTAIPGAAGSPLDPMDPLDAPPAWAAAPAQPPLPPPAPEGPRRVRGPWGLLTLLLAAGTAAVVFGLGHRHHQVNALAVVASALAVLGLGLILSGILRRRAVGLAVVAVLLSVSTVVVGVSPWHHWSRTTWAPASAAQLETHYSLHAGEATLDLTQVLPLSGQTVGTHISIGAGELQVLLPTGANSPEIKIDAQIGAGELRLPDGTTSSGLGRSRTVDLNAGASATHGTVQIELQVGAGQVEVVQ
ncbi:phage shock protein PspC (stress-responsive transcriptional regulator) [Streptacidiphilus sp. MAP12-20]|uniref:PspC domain-containing protein n=1 Tax=Streptacidiphilus sp. MAP12-20 TaxID=3156299 RepID=UPI003513D463